MKIEEFKNGDVVGVMFDGVEIGIFDRVVGRGKVNVFVEGLVDGNRQYKGTIVPVSMLYLPTGGADPWMLFDDAKDLPRSSIYNGRGDILVKVWAHPSLRTLIIEGEPFKTSEWFPIGPFSIGCVLLNAEDHLGVSLEAIELLGDIKQMPSSGLFHPFEVLLDNGVGGSWFFAWAGGCRRYINVDRAVGVINIPDGEGKDFPFNIIPNEPPPNSVQVLEDMEKDDIQFGPWGVWTVENQFSSFSSLFESSDDPERLDGD